MRTVSCLHSHFNNDTWNQLVGKLKEKSELFTDEDRLLGGRNDVFKFHHEGRPIALKCFRNKGAWKKVAYRVSTSKARRSYEHSLRLIEVGIHSPQPIAWREDWEGPWLQESYYLSDFTDYSHDLSAIRNPKTVDWELKAKIAGETVGKMHQVEIDHLDLNSGNLLFAKNEDGEWESVIIDNNRMRMGPVSFNRGVKSLLLLGLEKTPLDILLSAYSNARDYEPERCRQLYFKTLARHHLKWRIKNSTRPWRRKLGL